MKPWFLIKIGNYVVPGPSTALILGWYRGPRPVIYATNPDFLKEVFIKESETYIDRPMLDRSDNVPHLIMLKGDYNQILFSTRNFSRQITYSIVLNAVI